MDHLSVGETVDDRYEIVARLGSGGMGTVYKAHHREIDRFAAIKILHPRFTSDPSAVKRFVREGRILCSLEHANTVNVYSIGAHRGFVYIAMEFVDGTSLGELLQRKGRLQLSEGMPLFQQISSAMGYAHQHQVLHRDLKPDNVIEYSTQNGQLFHAKAGRCSMQEGRLVSWH